MKSYQNIDDLQAQLAQNAGGQVQPKPPFIGKSMRIWMDDASKRPEQKKLLGNLFYEGEVGILFADTNLGKSLLAMQLADAVARGQDTMPELVNEAGALKVVYLDFELSDKQQQLRYSDGKGRVHQFSDNLIRAELQEPVLKRGELKKALVNMIEGHQAKLLIVDNLTWLNTNLVESKEAGPMMQMLKEIAREHAIALLAISHTPKRDDSQPIRIDDLAGSKMLANFADSVFAMGGSKQGDSIRYLKQLKQRNCEQVYGAGNVFECELRKQGAFLGFWPLGTGNEGTHLREDADGAKAERIQEAYERSIAGESNRQIANSLGVSDKTVAKWVARAKQCEPPPHTPHSALPEPIQDTLLDTPSQMDQREGEESIEKDEEDPF